MTNTEPVTPVLFRYFLGQFTDAIRIEWTANQVTHAAELNAAGVVTHASHPVPPALALAARDCLAAGLNADVPLTEYQGTESADEMFRQVAARCVCCGVVQPSADWLSNAGDCGRCFASRMAHIEPANEGTPEWLTVLRHAGAL